MQLIARCHLCGGETFHIEKVKLLRNSCPCSIREWNDLLCVVQMHLDI